MTAFWAERTGRERVLLTCLGLICLCYVLVAVIWQPLHRYRAVLLADIARYEQTEAILAYSAATGAAYVPPVSDMPLPALITEVAADYALTIRRLQPTANAVEVTLEDASFDEVMIWLDALERDGGLRVVTLALTRRPEPGLVATALTVGR